MQVEIIKDIQGSFLVIQDDGMDIEGYRFRMLFENHIDGVLGCMYSDIDGEETLSYDISGKISLSSYLQDHPADDRVFIRFLKNLIRIIEKLQLYLIGSDSILLDPDRVFTSDGEEFYFIVFPHPENSFSKNMLPLSEFLITKMPHDNHQAAAVGYNLYQSCVSEMLSVDRIKKIIAASEESHFEKRDDLSVSDSDRYGNSGIFINEEGEIIGESPKTETGKKLFHHEKEKQKNKNKSLNTGKKKEKKPPKARESGRSGNKDREERTSETSEGFFQKYFINGSSLLSLLEKIANRKKNAEAKKKKEPDDELEFVRTIISEAVSSDEPDDYLSEEQCTMILSKDNRDLFEADCYLIPKDVFHGRNIPLLLDEYCIGKRSAGADIDIDDDSVSRHHAKLKRKADTYELTDLGSTNGTMINGRRIRQDTPSVLEDGDEIMFGAAEYYFRIE